MWYTSHHFGLRCVSESCYYINVARKRYVLPESYRVFVSLSKGFPTTSSFPIGVTIDIENAFTTIAPQLEVHKMNTYFTTEVIVQIREIEGVKTGVIESMELGGKVIPGSSMQTGRIHFLTRHYASRQPEKYSVSLWLR